MPGRDRHRHRHARPHPKFFMGAAAVAVVAWFVSPLSDIVTDSLVGAIPIHNDIALGASGAHHAGYHLQHPCRAGRKCVHDIGFAALAAIKTHIPNLAQQIDAYNWHFEVTQQSFVNAFAYPGGRIYVTRGLLDASNDDEVAAVIGHEIGHVLQRHSQKRIIQQRLGRLLIEALLFGDGDGQHEGLGDELGGLLLGYSDSLSKMSYSRANEFEADRIGWLACNAMLSGCRAGSLQSFFRKLDGGNGATEWHSTHPGTKDRIGTLDTLQSEYEVGRHRGHHQSLSAFAPPNLVGGGSMLGYGGMRFVGGAWSMLPASAQRGALIHGLWHAASVLESCWEAILDVSGASDERHKPQHQRAKPSRYRDWAQPSPPRRQRGQSYYTPVD